MRKPSPACTWARPRKRGAADAVAIVEEYALRVAIGLAGLVNILDPELVVVSGGLVELGDVLLTPLRAAFAGRIEGSEYRPAVPIVRASSAATPGSSAPPCWREGSDEGLVGSAMPR